MDSDVDGPFPKSGNSRGKDGEPGSREEAGKVASAGRAPYTSVCFGFGVGETGEGQATYLARGEQRAAGRWAYRWSQKLRRHALSLKNEGGSAGHAVAM